jgi:protein ImuA
MQVDRAHIIKNLREHILFFQRFKCSADNSIKVSLGSIDNSFPDHNFPLGATHEFLVDRKENFSATSGFISHIISELMKRNGICIWINSSAIIFPPALKLFGIDPDRIVFIKVKRQKEILWVMEEALKCDGLAAVVGEISEINFNESRRFQLAVEKSRVTGFVIRNKPRNVNVTACVSRWRISPLPSKLEKDLPGVGFPRWKIELLKIRNGKPGNWKMEYSNGILYEVEKDGKLITEITEQKIA